MEKSNDSGNLVTIVVPVYNVENYIEQCINSIMEQSYDNIECIFVDDQGSDRSINICENIISEYNGNIQFKIVRHEKNKGLSEARNTGIKYSNGKWIYFLDSDDWIEKSAIEDMIRLTESYPNTTMVIGRMECPQKPTAYYYPFVNCSENIVGDAVGEYLFYSNLIPMNACDKLILKEIIVNHSLFFEPGLIYEDEMWIYKSIKYFNDISFIHNVSYIRNIVPNSIMTTNSLERTQRNCDKILIYILDNPSKRFDDIACLKYLKMFFSYYRFIPPEQLTNEIFKRFLIKLSKKNDKLVKLLKLYNLPQPKFIRLWMRKLIVLYINSLY